MLIRKNDNKNNHGMGPISRTLYKIFPKQEERKMNSNRKESLKETKIADRQPQNYWI